MKKTGVVPLALPSGELTERPFTSVESRFRLSTTPSRLAVGTLRLDEISSSAADCLRRR